MKFHFEIDESGCKIFYIDEKVIYSSSPLEMCFQSLQNKTGCH